MMSMAAFTKKAKDSEMLESICPYLTAIFLPADNRHHELSSAAHSSSVPILRLNRQKPSLQHLAFHTPLNCLYTGRFKLGPNN